MGIIYRFANRYVAVFTCAQETLSYGNLRASGYLI